MSGWGIVVNASARPASAVGLQSREREAFVKHRCKAIWPAPVRSKGRGSSAGLCFDREDRRRGCQSEGNMEDKTVVSCARETVASMTMRTMDPPGPALKTSST